MGPAQGPRDPSILYNWQSHKERATCPAHPASVVTFVVRFLAWWLVLSLGQVWVVAVPWLP